MAEIVFNKYVDKAHQLVNEGDLLGAPKALAEMSDWLTENAGELTLEQHTQIMNDYFEHQRQLHMLIAVHFSIKNPNANGH